MFKLLAGVVGPIGSCVPMPKPGAGVFGAAGGRDPANSKSKVSLLMICNESSNDMFVVFVFDVSDNDGSNVNKMSDRMSDFSCVSTLSAVNKWLHEQLRYSHMAIFREVSRRHRCDR